MTSKELKDILQSLKARGWQPMVCDTPVPFYESDVLCGEPTGIGDIVEETRMLPKEFLSMQPEFIVTVKGDSMKDAGIVEGDAVKVETGISIHDGDIVLAMIDGDFTLKCYCEDEEGTPWLVPQNPAYEPFSLKETQNVWILGRVSKVIKQTPRINYRSCMKLIKKAKAGQTEPREIGQMQVSRAIREVAQSITVARQWYAVYRTMADLCVVGENDYDLFVEMVRAEVPEHASLPSRVELQRMAVDSFAKPVVLWRLGNAPVQGKRYNDYLAIAQKTRQLLGA
jgi:hypothetical protein